MPLLSKPLHPEMGREILKLLGSLQDLPAQGIVAGQSVASALIKLYGDGRPAPINDIDIYVRQRPGTGRSPRSLRMGFAPERFKVKKEDGYGYAGRKTMLSATTETLFSIGSVRMDGLLNFVECEPGSYMEQVRLIEQGIRLPLTASRVLASFDLNCVQAGVDLSTGNLHWTPAFERFLRGGQMEIVSSVSPFHTFARIEKKAVEMPWAYWDREATQEGLLLPWALCASEAKKGNIKGRDAIKIPKFGKKYVQMRDKFPHLANLFDVTPSFKTLPDGHTVELYEAVPKDDTISQEMLESFKKEKLRNLSPARGTLGLISMAFAPGWSYGKRLRLGEATDRKRKLIAFSDFLEESFDNFQMGYLDGQIQSAVAEENVDFLQKHGAFSYKLLGLSFEEQTRAIKALKKVEKENGRSALGELETSCIIGEEVLNGKDSADFLRAIEVSALAPFDGVSPLNLEAIPLPEDAKAEEILNAKRLKKEGDDMRHCVGGYSGQIKSGKSRIISIQTEPSGGKKERSTLELSFVAIPSSDMALGRWLGISDSFPREMRIAQHRGFANAIPSENHLEMGKRILDGLNEQATATLSELLARRFPSIDLSGELPMAIGGFQMKIRFETLRPESPEFKDTLASIARQGDSIQADAVQYLVQCQLPEDPPFHIALRQNFEVSWQDRGDEVSRVIANEIAAAGQNLHKDSAVTETRAPSGRFLGAFSKSVLSSLMARLTKPRRARQPNC